MIYVIIMDKDGKPDRFITETGDGNEPPSEWKTVEAAQKELEDQSYITAYGAYTLDFDTLELEYL